MKLKYSIETPLDAPVEPGVGSVFLLQGWAYCPRSDTKGLSVEFGGVMYPVVEYAHPRNDKPVVNRRTNNAIQYRALWSRFWVPLPVKAEPFDQQVPLKIVACLHNGKRVESPVHFVTVSAAKIAQRPEKLTGPLSATPKVCICMATYNPTKQMLERQIGSIRAQEYKNWACLIQDDLSDETSYRTLLREVGDDPRFSVERNTRNVGFYYNFETALRRVPANCELVCLSDQDDSWHRNKLSELVAAFSEHTTLAYSDMRIVGPDGEVLSESYWVTRANNYTDLETLFFTNTVTGAASMFRANLLPLILPFPKQIGVIYHDWWIALIALAVGKIEYVDRALYDYYQHVENVIGWFQIDRTISLRQFIVSTAYRRWIVRLARFIYSNEFKFQAMVALMIKMRVSNSRHADAIERINGLTHHPLRTVIGQYFRARFTGRRQVSCMREKNILMAVLLSRML